MIIHYRFVMWGQHMLCFSGLRQEKSLSRVRLFATPWTVAHQAPQSMGFSRHEWVAISFSRESSRPRDRTPVSHIVGRRFTVQATREAFHRRPGGSHPPQGRGGGCVHAPHTATAHATTAGQPPSDGRGVSDRPFGGWQSLGEMEGTSRLPEIFANPIFDKGLWGRKESDTTERLN